MDNAIELRRHALTPRHPMKFLSLQMHDAATFAAMLASPTALLAQLRPYGDIRLAPIDAAGRPLVSSLFLTAQTEADVAGLFSTPVCAGSIVVDCRRPGEAHPWPIIWFGESDGLPEKAADLDYMAAHPPTAAPDVSAILLGYAEEAADRLRAWATWHIARGELRGVSGTSIKALWRVAGSVDDLTWEMGHGANAATLAECADAILEAVDDALDAAEARRGGYKSHGQDQLIEVETGRMRPIARVIISVLDQIEMVTVGNTSPTSALVQSAHWMIYATPAPPVTV